jgi:predicted Rossmann-fold nucleotide-binding protein
MRLLVCGGRAFDNYELLSKEIDKLSPTLIISGGASGADSLARRYADANNIPCRIFEAKWTQYGKAAGPIRNAMMLEKGQPDLVLAFPGGDGTKDMVERAMKAQVRIRVISPLSEFYGG